MSHLRRASLLLESTVPVRTPKCSRQSLQRLGIGFPDLIVATETELQCGQTRFPCQRLSSKKVRADSSLGNCWKNWYRLIVPILFNKVCNSFFKGMYTCFVYLQVLGVICVVPRVRYPTLTFH